MYQTRNVTRIITFNHIIVKTPIICIDIIQPGPQEIHAYLRKVHVLLVLLLHFISQRIMVLVVVSILEEEASIYAVLPKPGPQRLGPVPGSERPVPEEWIL